jgi:hypothetical protein
MKGKSTCRSADAGESPINVFVCPAGKIHRVARMVHPLRETVCMPEVLHELGPLKIRFRRTCQDTVKEQGGPHRWADQKQSDVQASSQPKQEHMC